MQRQVWAIMTRIARQITQYQTAWWSQPTPMFLAKLWRITSTPMNMHRIRSWTLLQRYFSTLNTNNRKIQEASHIILPKTKFTSQTTSSTILKVQVSRPRQFSMGIPSLWLTTSRQTVFSHSFINKILAWLPCGIKLWLLILFLVSWAVWLLLSLLHCH